ncbi:winged helix-turn-helix transcriptional regulator [Streptomyces sp. A7024]|uniref:Winged helix-turn-helix transcriptional regulator n=1 Tax=Streptomyces coryli TaxID=1128680 RepID=A0A6G4U5U3_9ACTN|nr:MarR family winged helix-turn-helix transcriptional regulator [Streptomyces coryli]NGN66571.1 winged helix-turn-helix transcriptional regulator [Streptomyces coryli]
MTSTPELLQLLTRAERLAVRGLRQVLSDTDSGLNVDGWRVLALLADGAGHRMTTVADCAFLPPASLTKLMDQLVDQGLVHRRVDPLDRRRILAYLTPRGREVWAEVDARLGEEWAGAGASPDAEALATLLGRLAEALEGAEGGAEVPAARR